MPVIFNPADGAVLSDDAVFHVIQVILAVGDLFPDTLFHLVQVVGMHDALKGVACQFPEFFYGFTAEHAD